jgi:hypothetical protein
MDHTTGEMNLFSGYVCDAELNALVSLIHLKSRIIAVMVGQRHKIISLLTVMTEERTGIALCIRAVAVTVEISAKRRKLIKIFGERINIELSNLFFVLFKLEKIFLLAVEGIAEFKDSVLGNELYGVLRCGSKIVHLVIVGADDVEVILCTVKKEKSALIGNDLDLGFFAHRNNRRYYAVICYCRKHLLTHSLMLLHQLYHYIFLMSTILENHKQNLIKT